MERSFVLETKGLQIPCICEEPEFGSMDRCFIGIHGFCGNKDREILKYLAEELCLFGAVSVRFDLPAHGDSPVTDLGLSLEKCVDSVLGVVEWAHGQYPQAEICIFASGFGGYVTLTALDELKQMVGKLKLVLQTPDLDMPRSLLKIIGMTEEQFHKVGRVIVGAGAVRAVEVPYSFYQEMQAVMLYTNYHMPILVLHAERDRIVSRRYLEPFRRFNPQSKLVVIPDADHHYWGDGQWDMVVDLTRDWFDCEQVLLCDWM